MENIAIKNLGVSINDYVILESVSFILSKGQCVGLIGKNGAGKTSFLRLLSGELQDQGGPDLSYKCSVTSGDIWTENHDGFNSMFSMGLISKFEQTAVDWNADVSLGDI